jgi:Raf kinase inhibitor-like YbhB/YbcL family protein
MRYRTSALRTGGLVGIAAAATFALAACGGGSGYGSAATATPRASTAAAAVGSATAPAAGATQAVGSTLTLTSDAFTNNATIPAKYSCSGEATSPALSWSGAPAGTKAFALIVHDPDAPLAGGFTHWILVDLPGTATSLPAAVPAGDTISGGGAQPIPYRGMCPPVGGPAHNYHFRLYALDAPLGAAAGATKDSVEAAMQGHVLAQTDLVGLFSR